MWQLEFVSTLMGLARRCRKLQEFLKTNGTLLASLCDTLFREELDQTTERRMLKRESDNILNPFNRHRKRVSGKPFADYNFDPTKIIGRVPMVLSKKLLTKAWEPKRL